MLLFIVAWDCGAYTPYSEFCESPAGDFWCGMSLSDESWCSASDDSG